MSCDRSMKRSQDQMCAGWQCLRLGCVRAIQSSASVSGVNGAFGFGKGFGWCGLLGFLAHILLFDVALPTASAHAPRSSVQADNASPWPGACRSCHCHCRPATTGLCRQLNLHKSCVVLHVHSFSGGRHHCTAAQQPAEGRHCG